MESVDGLALLKKARVHVNKEDLISTLKRLSVKTDYIQSLYDLL